MGMKSKLLLLGVLVAHALVLTPFPASAQSGTIHDASDGQGPLAIDRVDYFGETQGIMRVTFSHSLKGLRVFGKNFVVFDIDYNRDGRSDRWYYLQKGRGGWSQLEYNPKTKKLVSEGGCLCEGAGRRAMRFRVGAQYFSGKPGYGEPGYGFRVASLWKSSACPPHGCFDLAPNHGYVLHDYGLPTIKRFEAPPLVVNGDATSFPVLWRVIDKGLSGFREAKLLEKPWQKEAEWEQVASSRSTGLVRKDVSAKEGDDFELMLRAWDGVRNQSSSAGMHVVVPFDQTTGSTISGLWTESADPATYLGSELVSSSPLDTFTFSGYGNEVCLLYRMGPGLGTGELSING